MALSTGTRLGPYEILAPLGAGGMGEVYLARDMRLQRTVAVKVLPQHMSASPESRQRFEREARTISQLSHPHICALYDVGRDGETDYLVMELLEGETLQDRLAKGRLPLEQTLRCGVEIADALDRAHRQSIVHRDLKPGNVMLTKSGVKLLDFGLAKEMPRAAVTGNLTALPTRRDLTHEGTVIGTFQYMAPEQLEGKDSDPRTDIFALGVVLYEMATGRKAFTGSSQASLISAIMTADPAPISSVQPMSPPALDRLVRKCLVKDPDERWQSAHDLQAELKWIEEGGQQEGPQMVSGKQRRRRWMMAVAVPALAMGMAALGWGIGERALRRPLLRLVVPTPPGTQLSSESTQVVALSPDGSMMVFSAYGADGLRLYSRRMDRFDAIPIAGSEGGVDPVFSPDGEWLAFYSRLSNSIRKVQVRGGTPIDVVAAPELGSNQLGLAWGEDDTLYFVRGFTNGIWALPNGGSARAVTKTGTAKDDRAHLWPQVLQGAKALLFTVWTGASWDDARIEAVSLESGARTVLLRGGTHGRYVPTGHLVYARGGSLFAVRFDPGRPETRGDPVQVIEGVATGASNGEARFDFSRTGTLIYEPGGLVAPARNLVWVDRSGGIQKITDAVRPFGDVTMSPDGKRLVVTLESSTFDLWTYDMERDTFTKLTFGGDDSAGTWSAHGDFIAYSSTKSGAPQIYVKRITGAGEEEPLTTGPAGKTSLSWTPDGKEVVVQILSQETGWDLYTIPISGDHTPRLLVGGPYDQRNGMISPDGRWVSFRSNESGRDEVYVQSRADGTMKTQVSREGGSDNQWAKSGKELFFRQGGKMFSIPIDAGPDLRVGKPALLFEDRIRWHRYLISPDGRRFLVVRDAAQGDASANQVNVVLNWFDDLKQRMGSSK